MSNIIEFPIGRNYANYWTVPDGIRELYANMLDYAKMNPNAVEFHYDSITKCLHIANAVDEPMAVNALVLGNSNKEVDEIGQFGEGMKMAYLALVREGRKVTTINVDEVWTPSFQQSEQFGVETLCVEIKPNDGIQKLEVRHIIEVTEEEVRTFMENTVTFHRFVHGTEPYKIETSKGTVLLGATMNGHIYVGGLLVTRTSSMTGIGLDIKPEFAKLGRDRKSIDNQDENLVYEIIGEALLEAPDEMRAALSQNTELRRDIMATVGFKNEAPEGADDDTVRRFIAMRRLRDTMIKPMIEDIEAKLANGAKYIVTEYLDKNCIEAVGADLFIRVPYGMAQQMREHFGLQKPIDALSDWFTNPYVMYKKLMEDETLSDKERLARLGELSSTWDAMRPWNV